MKKEKRCGAYDVDEEGQNQDFQHHGHHRRDDVDRI